MKTKLKPRPVVDREKFIQQSNTNCRVAEADIITARSQREEIERELRKEEQEANNRIAPLRQRYAEARRKESDAELHLENLDRIKKDTLRDSLTVEEVDGIESFRRDLNAAHQKNCNSVRDNTPYEALDALNKRNSEIIKTLQNIEELKGNVNPMAEVERLREELGVPELT